MTTMNAWMNLSDMSNKSNKFNDYEKVVTCHDN